MPTLDKEQNVFVFSDEEKKQIFDMIDSEAKAAATEREDDGQGGSKYTYKEWKHKAALPTDAEFARFIYIASQRKMNPLLGQLIFQKRQGRMIPLVPIDAYRLIAERTGTYAPGKSYECFDANDKPAYAGIPNHVRTYAKKKSEDGIWHEFSDLAFFTEYAQYTGTGQNKRLGGTWATKGRLMIAKCCEARMLRRGWPQECGGLYIREELDQLEREQENEHKENRVQDDLSTMKKGSPNKGHGNEGTQRTDPPKQEAAKQEPPKEEHPKPTVNEIEVNIGTDEKPKMVKEYEVYGWVETVEDKKSDGSPLITSGKAPFLMVVVPGLGKDNKKFPHDKLACYHQSLFDAVQCSRNEMSRFLVSYSVDKGTKNASHKGIVRQQIEDVLQIGDVPFEEGKPVGAQEVPPENLDAEPVEQPNS